MEKRVRRTRWVHSERLVVAVDVELVVPPDDTTEPCYEAEAVRFLREAKEHADRNDLLWLQGHGKVYALVEAA